MIQFGVSSFLMYSLAMDMRKGIHSLMAVVQGELGRNPTSGEAYVFIGKSRKTLKVLIAKPQGFWLCQHRLTSGTFQMREARRTDGGAIAIQLSALDWQALLDGVVIKRAKHLPRFTTTDPISP